jgi:tetratricopeptide (TPR) repeat protein
MRISSPALLLLGLCLASAGADEANLEPPTQEPLSPVDVGEKVTRGALMDLRDIFVRIGDFTGALGPAQQIVQQTIQEVGETDPRLVADLNVLAEIQREIGQYALAQETYLRSIDILENQNNKFPPELVEPYHGLGKNFLATESYAAAMTAFDQARHVSRRNLGLFNIEQIDILDDQTAALLGLGDVPAAGELQRERIGLAIRAFGESSVEVVPYHYHLADYYASSRMKTRARDEYQRAADVLSAAAGEYATDLLDPLSAIIALNMGDNDTGVEAVRIRTILDNNDNIPAMERAAALTSLGDWHLVRLNNLEDALSYYRAAYAAAPDENRDDIFSVPALLDFVPPMIYISQRKARKLRNGVGTISLEFTVNPDGTTSEARVVTVEPPDSVEADYLEGIAAARFRPRFVDGAPVATERTRMNHQFWYFIKN